MELWQKGLFLLDSLLQDYKSGHANPEAMYLCQHASKRGYDVLLRLQQGRQEDIHPTKPP